MEQDEGKLFEKSIVVRPLRLTDYDELAALWKRCFPAAMGVWKREQIESQLRIFPEGQIVIEYGGKLVASSSSVIIDFDEYDDTHSWKEVSDGGYIRNHDPEGDTLYGLEIMVDPEFRGMKFARRLYDARKHLCVEWNLRRMMIGGRIPGYQNHKDAMTPRQYVNAVVSNNLYDPVLSAQLANGFLLKRLIPAYTPDEASGDMATLLEWANIDYQPKNKRRRLLSSMPVRICVVQYQMRTIRSYEEFAQSCEYFVDVAADYKSDFLVFPEIFTTQLLSFMPTKDSREAVRRLAEYTDQYVETFRDLAIRYNVNIVGGSHFTNENDKIYNVAYLFKRNGEVGKQYKLHITPSERHWFGVQPGGRIEVFDTDRGKVAIQICYDIEFPELSRIAVEKGARIVFTPFCTDVRAGYLRVRYCAQARCIENQIFVATAGTVGNLPHVQEMDIHYAQSGIFTPSDFGFARDGVAAECTPNIETLVVQDVDLAVLERHRRGGTVMNWADRRTDLYRILTTEE
jgi:predicted amidohydrolase/ribosomal protein S18 acetylase RimI-like enzyme